MPLRLSHARPRSSEARRPAFTSSIEGSERRSGVRDCCRRFAAARSLSITPRASACAIAARSLCNSIIRRRTALLRELRAASTPRQRSLNASIVCSTLLKSATRVEPRRDCSRSCAAAAACGSGPVGRASALVKTQRARENTASACSRRARASASSCAAPCSTSACVLSSCAPTATADGVDRCGKRHVAVLSISSPVRLCSR